MRITVQNHHKLRFLINPVQNIKKAKKNSSDITKNFPEVNFKPLCHAIFWGIAPAGFICSKLIIETLEQGVKYVQI